MGIEDNLRAALAAEGVPMARKGRVGVLAQGPIAAGGRDDALTRGAGRASRAVWDAEFALWEAISDGEELYSRFEGPDKPDASKSKDKLFEFVLRDSIVRIDGKPVWQAIPGRFDADGEPVLEEVRRLPYGWDEGLSSADKMRWGLDRVQTAYGERYIARHYVLIARTGQLVDTRTGEILSIGVVLNREVGSYVAFHPQTRRKEDTVKECRALRRVEYAKLLPGRPPGIVKEPPYEVQNTWQGFAVPPVAGVCDGDIEPFLRLVRVMFPVIQEREHLLDWIAHLFQHPGVKMMHAVLIISEEQGVGKGTLAGVIGDMMHKAHRAEVSVEVIRSAFNANWAEARTFVFVDEVQSTDRMDVANYLKSLITGPTITINQKHVPAYEQENLINVMLASNKLEALPLEPQDRRYFVLRIANGVAARVKHDFDFTAFRDWRSDDLNIGRLLGWLLARDLARFNPKGHAPMTEGKMDLLDLTQPPWEGVLQHARDTGAGPFARGVVTVDGVVAFLAEHRHGKSPAHVREWLTRAGMVPVVQRMWVPRQGKGSARLQTTVWAVRDAERWRAADRGIVLAELARSVPWESRAMQAEREAGPHTSKKGESTPLHP